MKYLGVLATVLSLTSLQETFSSHSDRKPQQHKSSSSSKSLISNLNPILISKPISGSQQELDGSLQQANRRV